MSGPENTPDVVRGPEPSKEELRAKQRATLTEYGSIARAKSVAARKGKKLSQEHRDKLGASKRGRTPSRKIPLWMVAEDALLSLPSTESAKKREGQQADFYRVRVALGFPKGWPAAFRHGEVLTRLHIEEFCSDTGLSLKESAEFVGFGYAAFCNLIGKIPDRPLSSRHPKDPNSPHLGRLLKEKYEDVVSRFCYEQGKRWRVRNFLRSEILKLPVQHTALTEAFEQLRAALDREELTAEPTHILEWICREARLEEAAGSKRNVRLLLFCGLSFRDLLNQELELIGATEGRVSRLYWPRVMASKLLAHEYGAAENRIDAVIEGKETTPLDPRMLSVLLRQEQKPAIAIPTEEAKGGGEAKGGRPKGMTRDRLIEARRLEELVQKYDRKRGAVKRAAKEVYPGVDADLRYDRARQTLKDYSKWKSMNREKN